MRAALTYPAAVVAIAAVVVAAVLWKVVPAFTALFEGLGATLPLPTRVLIRSFRARFGLTYRIDRSCGVFGVA